MEKEVVAAMKAGLKRAASHPVGFAFSPNGDEPILLLVAPAGKRITTTNFKAVAEKEAGIAYDGGSIFIGDVTTEGGKLVFQVSPDDCKGTIDAAKMQRALLKLAKATSVTALTKADVIIGDKPANDGRPSVADEDREAAFARLRKRLKDVPGLLGEAAIMDGDGNTGPITLKRLAALRDELKLFLDSKHAKVGALTFGKKKSETLALVKEVEAALVKVRGAGGVLAGSLPGSKPKSAPEVQLNEVAPLAVDAKAIGKISKEVGKAVEAYRKAAGAHPTPSREAHHRALQELRTEVLAWQRRHRTDKTRAEHAAMRALLTDATDRLVELDLQTGIDGGYIATTGEGDTAAGQSGSYFVGSKQRGREFVLKPTDQEALLTASTDPGDGARNEVVSARAASFLRDVGLETHMPDAHFVTVRSDKVASFGQELAFGKSSAAVDKEKAVQRVQHGAAIRTVSNVRGSAADLQWRVHPTIPEIRMQEVREKEFGDWEVKNLAVARELFEAHDPTFADLDESAKVDRLKAFLARGGHRLEVELPEGMTDADLTNDLSMGLVMCAITGQQDHENVDNALVAVKDGRPRLVPIDFGVATPSLKDAALNFDLNTGTSRKDPWALWVSFPQADRAMPVEVLAKVEALDVDDLAATMEEEEDRVSSGSDGSVRSTTDEQRRLRRFQLRAMKEAVTRAKQHLPPVALSPRAFHDVFVHDTGVTGPFCLAIQALQARPAKQRDDLAWEATWTAFCHHLDAYLDSLTVGND